MSMEYPCIYFEGNGRCRKFSDENTTSYCVMGPCTEQKLSNADRIRAMSDEELANWLKTMKADSKEYLLKWLQLPSEEDI